MNQSPHRPEVLLFAERIREKCIRRRYKKGSADLHWPDAVRDMVRDLLTKEGWRRDPAAAVGNPTP